MIRIPTAKMTRDEWVSKRRELTFDGMLGGSDIGTILGLNEWKSSLELFHQAIGLREVLDIDNENMFHGRNREDYVADLWEYYDGTTEGMMKNHSEGRKVSRARKVNAILINEAYPFLFANVDRMMSKVYHGRKGILEIKTISGYHSDRWEGGVPPAYIAQVQAYMIVTKAKYAEIAELVDGNKFEVFPIEPLDNLQLAILEKGYEWQQRVRKGRELVRTIKNENELLQAISEIEPEANGTKAWKEYLTERHKARMLDVKLTADEQITEWSKQYMALNKVSKEIEENKTKFSNLIKHELIKNGAVEAENEEIKITYRKQFIVKEKKGNESLDF